MHLRQSRQDLGALGEVEGGNHLLLLQPLVDAELIAEVAALEHQELLVELLVQLPLPLERQVGGTDDEHLFDEAAQLELAEQEPRHDGLAGAGVVGAGSGNSGRSQEGRRVVSEC